MSLYDRLVPAEALRFDRIHPMTVEPGCVRDLEALIAEHWPDMDVVNVQPADTTGRWWYVRHPMTEARKVELGHDPSEDLVDTFLTQIDDPPPFWPAFLTWMGLR